MKTKLHHGGTENTEKNSNDEARMTKEGRSRKTEGSLIVLSTFKLWISFVIRASSFEFLPFPPCPPCLRVDIHNFHILLLQNRQRWQNGLLAMPGCQILHQGMANRLQIGLCFPVVVSGADAALVGHLAECRDQR